MQYVEMGRPLILARHSVTKPKPAEPTQSDVFVADRATQLEVPSPSCRRRQDEGGEEESAESHASSDTLKAEGQLQLFIVHVLTYVCDV